MMPADVPTASADASNPLAARLFAALAWATLALFPVTLYAIFLVAPVEARMGVVQKIFYFHVPAAYAMYIGFATAAVASILYLLGRGPRWDAYALAGAEVGLLFATMVLVSGPLWARKAWGVYWTWDPRLTSVMLLSMVFTAYIALRGSGDAGEVEKRFAAGLSLLALPLIPIVNQSVQRWRGVHPTVITGRGGGLHPDMLPAFFLGLTLFTGLVLLLLRSRARLELLRERTRTLELRAARAGLLDDDR